MKTRTRNIISATTALAGLAGLAWLIIIFGEVPAWMSRMNTLYVDLDNGGGLASGSRVRLSGLDVGYVESVRLTEQPLGGVEAICRIYPEFRIPKQATVQVPSGLFGGSGYLALTIPPQIQQTPPDQVEYVEDGGRIAGSAASAISQLQGTLSQRLEKFEKMADSITALSEEYLQVGKKINTLLEERSTAEVDSGNVQPNLHTVLSRADADLAELRKTIDGINKYVTNAQLHDDVLATAHNARELTTTAKADLDKLTTRYVALADDMSKTLAQLDGLLTDARTGKGTVGKLVQDPALYDSLNDAAGRMGEALKEFKLLIEKWKAEGLPIQF
jgi:phospholipid/cholesterol/gamma-HCH transport system substrate-binding protein